MTTQIDNDQQETQSLEPSGRRYPSPEVQVRCLAVNPSKLETADIKKAHQFWSEKKCDSFAKLHRRKAWKWPSEKMLSGARRGRPKVNSHTEGAEKAANLNQEDNSVSLGSQDTAEEDRDPEEELSDDDEVAIQEEEIVVEEESTPMPPPKKAVAKKKKAMPSMDQLSSQLGTMSVTDFNMGFSFPHILIEHKDHGQKLASIESLVVGVHRQHVHLKILPCCTILQVKVAVPQLFCDGQRALVANDDGSGAFSVNAHKATSFSTVCEDIGKTANDDMGGVFGAPQNIKLPFECNEIFNRSHAGDQEEWGMQVHDNDDLMLKKEVGNTDLFALSIDCVSKEKPLKKKTKGKMWRVTEAAPKRKGRDGDGDMDES